MAQPCLRLLRAGWAVGWGMQGCHHSGLRGLIEAAFWGRSAQGTRSLCASRLGHLPWDPSPAPSPPDWGPALVLVQSCQHGLHLQPQGAALCRQLLLPPLHGPALALPCSCCPLSRAGRQRFHPRCFPWISYAGKERKFIAAIILSQSGEQAISRQGRSRACRTAGSRSPSSLGAPAPVPQTILAPVQEN